MPAGDTQSGDTQGILLRGLDGSNPLGFLAAVGTLHILDDARAGSGRLGWRNVHGSWRPVITGYGDDERELCGAVLRALKNASAAVFDIGKENRNGKEFNKFPFARAKFVQALEKQQGEACPSGRRNVDFLAGFGTELYPDTKKDEFRETRFRMVRAGDSKRQGMLCYADANRKALGRDHVERTLFQTWDYADKGYSLRWDPTEDQPYALRWRNPSVKSRSDGTMLAANCLAVEALRCFPTFAIGRRAHTTGFQRREDHEIHLVWPVWTPMVDVETLRCLVALDDLHKSRLPRPILGARGIEEVYCARRVRQNQYYSNFAPAQPLP